MSEIRQPYLILKTSWLGATPPLMSPSKCKYCMKYMLFSHKPSQLPSFVPSFLAGSPIDLVSTFKYLGVLLTPTLFWPTHICSRSRKILGIIFPAALLQILLSYHSHSPVHLPHSPYSRALCLCRIPLPNLSFILESILNRTSKFIPSLIPNLSASHSISP